MEAIRSPPYSLREIYTMGAQGDKGESRGMLMMKTFCPARAACEARRALAFSFFPSNLLLCHNVRRAAASWQITVARLIYKDVSYEPAASVSTAALRVGRMGFAGASRYQSFIPLYTDRCRQFAVVGR
jgi:hypothetical protein